MNKTNLLQTASSLAGAWRSVVVGQAAGANIKVLRMDSAEYPAEVHDFDEALLVMEGVMHLQFAGERLLVAAGELCVVPAGVPHAVATGSHGTLLIIDPPADLPA